MNLGRIKNNNQHGFTMLELVIIVSVILALGAAVTIWIDPVQRIGDAKQAKRQEAVMMLSTAFTEYAQSHKGALPIFGEITTEAKVICNNQTGQLLTCDTSSEYCLAIDDADFFTKNISNLPIDPDKSSDSDTGYYIRKDADNNIIIGACDHTFGYAYDRPQLRSTCDAYAAVYCWYGEASTDSSYTICANAGLTCVSLSHTADSLCLISNGGNGSYTCASGCSIGTSTQPPTWTTGNVCTYQNGTLDCAASSSNNAVCPCQ